jgi:hypothetical protein
VETDLRLWYTKSIYTYDPSSSLGGIFMDIRHPPYILRKIFLSVIKESGNVFINLTNFFKFFITQNWEERKKKKKTLA